MSILAINSGSTSLKFGVFDTRATRAILAGDIDWASGDRLHARLTLQSANNVHSRDVAIPDDRTAAKLAIRTVLGDPRLRAEASPVEVVGHRVVHGGATFQQSVLIDDAVRAVIASLSALAPLHNPPALRAIEATGEVLPGAPQVAVFDTAFFAQLPPRAFLYPLPFEYYERWGIRRYGFHGLSHGYCATRATEMLGTPARELRLISCHLGGGCSAVAIQDGQPLATTLGFSPLDGLMMGTRTGTLDPGILLHLQQEHGVGLDELHQALNRGSGLLGISGISADLALIERAATEGNERARLAFDMFCDRVRSAIGAMAATLGGADALIFTDRIGENSPALRQMACAGLGFMGLELDPTLNAHAVADTDIATTGSRGRILVIHTREELLVAREARRILDGSARNA